MDKNALLATLYYQLGKQATNFALQHSHKEGEETIWTKRHTFLELCEDPTKYEWFIQHCNHRQILQNEIILDFDRTIDNTLEDEDIKEIVRILKQDHWRFCVYHTGSRGVHIHIFNEHLILKKSIDREKYRTAFINVLQERLAKGLDLQKASDKTMIALENTPHWKTGIKKTIILNHGVEEWT